MVEFYLCGEFENGNYLENNLSWYVFGNTNTFLICTSFITDYLFIFKCTSYNTDSKSLIIE